MMKRALQLALVVMTVMLAAAGCSRTGQVSASRAKRFAMINTLRVQGIRDERVLDAMIKVPRHEYIPEGFRSMADPYGDYPFPIGYDQTISQPYIVAYMTEKMDVQPGEKVLEIGTGSGYQAAVLAELGADVYSIEIIPELADHARQALKATGYRNVQVRTGDGYQGWPEEAPFDMIIVTCAPTEVPRELVKQLKNGGRMIVPVGRGPQRLVILRKRGGEVFTTRDIAVRFVPMVHEAEAAE